MVVLRMGTIATRSTITIENTACIEDPQKSCTETGVKANFSQPLAICDRVLEP